MSLDNIPERFRQRIQAAKEQQLEKLDLSNGRLTEIPDAVFELTYLRELDLSNNNITYIPSQISRLTKLQILDLIGNKKLVDIPQELIQLPSLVFLRLTWKVNTIIPECLCQVKQLGLHLINQTEYGRYSFIETTPDAIINLKNLVFLRIWIRFSESWIPWLKNLEKLDLDLRNNRLTDLPESITNLSNLTRLDLKFNRLNNFPESITNLSNLARLDLSNNQLTDLPESITNLSNLTRLDLSNNQLTDLPESINNLSNLTRLDLSNNQLTDLPESITNLSTLTRLDLSNNQLTDLPESITNLSNLIRLDLRNNQLTNLPESITNLSNLIRLDLSNNQLTDLPESITNLSTLIRLDLRNNQLTNLPESITNLSTLIRLNLSNNQLTNLPESIPNLSTLTELYLNDNRLTDLPESITNLSTLIRLDLRNNQLTNLPESITNLSTLTELDLSSNQLTNLPESITNLSNLTRLYLNDNRLTDLPESITNLSTLTRLYLNSNQLTNLPESITNLSTLTRLDLSYNQLTDLPESITNLSTLTELDLSNNPLETPPLEVANRGIKAIREYFRQLREKGKDYIYEAKLLIVGEGGAGKTTLAKKIENPQYQVDTNEPSTEGIDITKWTFPLDDKREFTVNIWDFGGQEIYKATHQFFLTKHSLYALVADTRREDTDFYYWLNIVELLSNNSPCLIIKNEKEDRRIEIDIDSLRGRFDNLQESLATNLKYNRGLNTIVDSLKYHIKKLPHVGSALPKTWKQVREILEQDQRNYISLEEYLEICQDNDFTRREDQLQLSGYLHDLGVCLHFQDSPLLKNTVILKPEWGTGAVYKVLDDKQVINNLGRFTTKDLDNIWSDEQYCFKQAELLELMMRFKLCYQIPETQDTYIAPQLLTKTKPKYNWNTTDNLILRYTYEFMPKGIITQLIVAMHQYIEQQQYVWRSGVVLKKDKTKAEVIEYYDQRDITIRVTGKSKRKLMTEVTYELDKINNSYKQLKYQKLIPCNCEACQNSQNPYTYQFQELVEKRLANNKLTIECGNPPFHEVQVLSLIDNSIDIQQLISQTKQDKNQDINVQGNIQQLIFRYVAIQKGNYNEHLEQDYIEGNYTDQSRTQNINAKTINTEGAASFNLGDISGTVANTINQLPNFDDPNKTTLKQLLIQLHNTVIEENLDTDEKQESLAQIKAIASALQNPQDGAVKKLVKKAMKGLGGTAFTLPSDSSYRLNISG